MVEFHQIQIQVFACSKFVLKKEKKIAKICRNKKLVRKMDFKDINVDGQQQQIILIILFLGFHRSSQQEITLIKFA